MPMPSSLLVERAAQLGMSLICLFVQGCTSNSAPAPDRAGMQAIKGEIAVDVQARTYRISVTNTSQKDAYIWDCITPDSQYTEVRRDYGPAMTQVRDATGDVVSTNPLVAEGWWTFGALSSSVEETPVTLRRLRPGETLEGTFSIASLCLGLADHAKLFDAQLGGKSIRLKATLYTDEWLRHGLELRTDWTTIPLR